MRRWYRIVLASLLFTVPIATGAQPVGVSRFGDSVSVRFVESELRTVIHALGQFLDQPVVISGINSAKVTFETPRPIPRSEVLALLRGLLEAQGLELVHDEAAGLFRVQSRADALVVPTPDAAQDVAVRPPIQLFTLRLRHARAADVAATVNTLYGRGGAVGELGPRRPPLSEQLAGNRSATTTVLLPGSNTPVQMTRSAGSPTAELIIVPDPGTNSLMIRATETDFGLIREAVQALDMRPLQVLIEVMIAEVRRDRGFSFGVGAEVPQGPLPGGGDATIGGSTIGGGLGDFALSVMKVGGADLNATLRAAAARGDVSILSRPVLLAANNEMAQILVGSQRPFVQVSRSLPTDAPQRDQVVQYKDVGTSLQVRPTISADGYVMLEVTQEVNAATTETAFDAPVISTRSVQTRLLVKDGQTAVLGGLADRQKDASQGGIPILSSIPLIGGLFGRVSRRTTETELFVFITPKVLYEDADVDAATKPLQERARRDP